MATTYDPLWLDLAMREAQIRTGELSKATGVSRSQIQRIRRGMAPRMDTLVALRKGLDGLTASPATPSQREAA